MPNIGLKPIRRASVVEAAIVEIGATGSIDVTVSRIAKRAGVSSALADDYFGPKERLFLAAMRHILSLHSDDVRAALAEARTPRAQVEAVVRASFGLAEFRSSVIAAWLMFYVDAQRSPEAARLLAIYKRRLRSNLLVGLRPLVGYGAEQATGCVAALIDGLFIRQSLGRGAPPDPWKAIALVPDCLACIAPPDAERGRAARPPRSAAAA